MSYKLAKMKLISKGASIEEADSLIARHKELKKLNRLDKSLIDIDKVAKDFLVSDLKQKLFGISTKTKSLIKKQVVGKIVGENQEYFVYKIDTPEEAYRFHGLAEWCICSGNKQASKSNFEQYSYGHKHVFYFFARKKITNPKDVWNCIALQRRIDKGDVYWDMMNYDHKSSDIPVELPEFTKLPLERFSLEEKFEMNGFKRNQNGEYDVDGDVFLVKFPELITNGKLNIRFNKVSGDFNCSWIKELTSLDGCPNEVGGNFDCSECENLKSLKGVPREIPGNFNCSQCNKLKSLKWAPKKVGGVFSCYWCNSLTNLEGAPKEVGGSFSCSDCDNLKSLKGAPKKVSFQFDCSCCFSLESLEGVPETVRNFNCSKCTSLTSLKGAPREVKGWFAASYCKKLTSLEGAPEKVVGSFHCNGCENLTSLEGAPKKVEIDFDCSNCKNLTSLDGVPERVVGEFNCSKCGTKFTEDEIRELCDVTYKITS